MIHNTTIDSEKLLDFYMLKNLVRFNMNFKHNNESVAEHSYFVTLFTEMICKELQNKNIFSDKNCLDCLRIAIIHDLPETETSDIPHPVKVGNKIIDERLKEMEYEYINNNFPQYFNLFKNYTEPVNNIDLEYYYVVQLADILSVLQFAYLEINMGNQMFEFILQHATKRYMEVKSKFEEHFGFELRIFMKDDTVIKTEKWC